jgi:hypothetical protein
VDTACAALIRVIDRVTPAEERRSRYEAAYDQFRALYPALKPSFTGLASVEDME